MVVADRQGIPLACSALSASTAEVTLVEETKARARPSERPLTPLIAGRAYDYDPACERLGEHG